MEYGEGRARLRTSRSGESLMYAELGQSMRKIREQPVEGCAVILGRVGALRRDTEKPLN